MSKRFEISESGLRKLLAQRGAGFIITELVQNAWDAPGVTSVSIIAERIAGTRRGRVVVEDDSPEGFFDLSHCYTFFAESAKRGDAQLRGRYNLGEKLVIVAAHEARIESTRGGFRFDDEGRHAIRTRRERGSRVEAIVPMTDAQLAECDEVARRLIPPVGIPTRYNDALISPPVVVFSTEEPLPTVIADAEGVMRGSTRKTRVDLLRAPPDGGWIFEMGIPVVPTGDAYHVNVFQKIPLNFERDNVPPGYLRAVRRIALNLAHAEINSESANSVWARQALADPQVSDEAVKAAFGARFGSKAVIFDSSDLEANKRAVSDGYTVVHASQLSGAEWANVKRANIVLPAGKVTPSAKCYGDGSPVKTIPREKWTASMCALVALTSAIGQEIVGLRRVNVTFEDEPAQPYDANYGRGGSMTFNLGQLGHNWPDRGITEGMIGLLIHEFGHELCSDHLDAKYYHALTHLGARLALKVRRDPAFLDWDRWMAAATRCVG